MSPPDPAFAWFTQLGVPALVAAGVTFFLNRLLEKQRGQREINSCAFETARDDTKLLGEAAANYWCVDGTLGDAPMETRIVLLQTDVSYEVGEILEYCSREDRSEIE